MINFSSKIKENQGPSPKVIKKILEFSLSFKNNLKKS